MTTEKRNRSSFLVLLALSKGPMHGYEISKFIEIKSNGFFRVPFGSLYPVLHKLESEKMISAEWNGSVKPKKVYALTKSGQKALLEELSLLQSESNAIHLLLGEGLNA